MEHWELQPDRRDVGVPVHGRWLCRGPCGGTHSPCQRRPPPEPPLPPAVSQIVTQDYCEAVQQLELEQDLRLQAEVFAHEVRPGPGSPCPWVLGGDRHPREVGERGGAACCRCPSMQTPQYSAHCCLSPGSREDGDAPGHPSRSPRMRSDRFCSQPLWKGFFSLAGASLGAQSIPDPCPHGQMLVQKKEANRQSMILLQNSEPSAQLLAALQEVGRLTRALEEARQEQQQRVRSRPQGWVTRWGEQGWGTAWLQGWWWLPLGAGTSCDQDQTPPSPSPCPSRTVCQAQRGCFSMNFRYDVSGARDRVPQLGYEAVGAPLCWASTPPAHRAAVTQPRIAPTINSLKFLASGQVAGLWSIPVPGRDGTGGPQLLGCTQLPPSSRSRR